VISHWFWSTRELRPLAVKIQCVALATKIREGLKDSAPELFIL